MNGGLAKYFFLEYRKKKNYTIKRIQGEGAR
jgi:hypothetical protein